jgi:hypothetical protein
MAHERPTALPRSCSSSQRHGFRRGFLRTLGHGMVMLGPLVGCLGPVPDDDPGPSLSSTTNTEQDSSEATLARRILSPASCTLANETRRSVALCSGCTSLNHGEALDWSAFLLGDTKRRVNTTARPFLKSLADCIEAQSIVVTSCPSASDSLDGKPLAWYKFAGECRGQGAGRLLQAAAEAYAATATADMLPLGPLVSWVPAGDDSSCKDASCNISATTPSSSVNSYGYITPAATTTAEGLMAAIGARAPGRRLGLPVTVHFWPRTGRTCLPELRGGDPCSGTPLSPRPEGNLATVLPSSILRQRDICRCL